jgi:replicative DNA helicase
MNRRAPEHNPNAAPESRLLDRTPPASLDAERAVLGAVLLDPSTLSTALEHVRKDDFFRDAHNRVFDAMCRLYERSGAIDLVTLSEELGVQGDLDRVGGTAYLATLLDAVPATTAMEHYARIVAEKALTRRMIYAAASVVEQGYTSGQTAREYLDSAERAIFEVLDNSSRHEAVPIKDALRKALERVQSLYERGQGITGVTSGFEKFDRITMGLQPSDLIILAARPGMGKTTFALNVACNAALVAKASVLLFSLEMGAEQLVMRLLSSEARVELSKLRGGRLDDRDWDDVANAAQRLAECSIYIDETPAISPLEVRARARRLKLENKCDLIMIDYLQLMSSSRQIQSREQQISEISRSLKELARELHVPVVALSQLNRGLESRTDKRPMMSDLRESGAIEQDADLILFIYRDEIYNPDTADKGIAEVIIGKHRNGPTGSVRVKFFNAFTRFDNLFEDDGPSFRES